MLPGVAQVTVVFIVSTRQTGGRRAAGSTNADDPAGRFRPAGSSGSCCAVVLRGRGAGQLLARGARAGFSVSLLASAASAALWAAFTVCSETFCAVRTACSV